MEDVYEKTLKSMKTYKIKFQMHNIHHVFYSLSFLKVTVSMNEISNF